MNICGGVYLAAMLDSLERGKQAAARAMAAPWALLAAATLLSLLVGLEVWRQAAATERVQFERRIDVHAKRLSDHLLARENIVRAVAATMAPPTALAPNPLGSFDDSLLTDLGDVFSLVWIASVPAAQDAVVHATLAAAGVPAPQILGADRTPLSPQDYTDPLVVVVDIKPRTPENLRSLGLNLASLPAPRAALTRAEETGKTSATAPVELVQAPGKSAVVVYAPAMDDGRLFGYVGMSFHYAPLVAAAFGADDRLAWRVTDADDPQRRTLASSSATVSVDRRTQRRVAFAGRTLVVDYAAPRSPDALLRGLLAGFATLAAGLGAFAVTWTLARARRRAEAAVAAHARAEAQLEVVVRELDHRVRNVLGVVQALVRQTLKDANGAGETLERRLGAFAAATTLIAQGGWRAVALRDVLAPTLAAAGDRIDAQGPEIALSAQAAQNLALAFHELWTNAVKHGALSTETGRVALSWALRDGRFTLDWREHGGPAAAAPARTGFGRQLLEKIVPRALDGDAQLAFGPDGFAYALSAPANAVVA